MTSVYRRFGVLRLILAMMVVVSHGVPASGFEGFLARLGIGSVAVMGFFVLSGFIITEAIDVYYRERPAAFIANRMLRILPPYWLALILSLMVHALLQWGGILSIHGENPRDIFSAQNIAANTFAVIPLQGLLGVFDPAKFYGFVRYYWAVLIEVDFYIVAFAIMLPGLVFKRKRADIAAACVAALLLCHVVNDYVRPIRHELSYIPYFALGVSLYAWRSGYRLALIGVIASAAATLVAFLRYLNQMKPLSALASIDDWPVVATNIVLLTIVCVAIFRLSNTDTTGPARRIDRWFGDLSYPIYLNHYTVLTLVFSLALPPWPSFLLIAAGSVLVAWGAATTLERPLRRLRDVVRGQTL
ncbi:MAG: acyltransferase [Rhizobiales bacterium]|nr:acyltransferase [Hyphomicrobiales bacterium]OJY41737.1 MAG: hypothetical protein BGP08_10185 [Rhizobiales bacterium 64-17]